MQTFFNLKYEFDRDAVHQAIESRLLEPGSDYICVADGVIMNTANRKPEYLEVVNGGMFSICDSSYVPLYIRWIHGFRFHQYAGSEIFQDIVNSGKYRMIFLGAQQHVLDGLRQNLMKVNPAVAEMQFVELPFRPVEQFDYSEIADIVRRDGAEIVWIALGAPKQEYFMAHLQKYLDHGVMIAVGAVFKFFSGVDTRRAPQWMVEHHLEFLHRLKTEPRKQMVRCYHIVATLPRLLLQEWNRRNPEKKQTP